MLKKLKKPALALLPSLRKLYRKAVVRFTHARRFFTPRRLLIGACASVFLLASGLAVSFFVPRTVNFSYAGDNCFSHPLLLPDLISRKESERYLAEPVASLSIAGYPLFSRTTCVEPAETPREKASEVISFGFGVFKKNIRVSAGAFPSVANQEVLDSPVSTQQPLTLELNSVDRTFNYKMLVGDASLPCPTQEDQVSCNLAELKLAQSATYTFKLERLFQGKPAGSVLAHPVTTVQDVHVAASSIAPGQIVYSVPNDIILTLNRTAVSMEGAKLYLVNGETRSEVPITATLSGQTVTARFAQPLARSASFVLEIKKITAEDGGFLSAPIAINFQTSGGPKVTNVSIGSYKVSTGANIVLTFDSDVLASQALGNFIQLEADGGAVAATLSVSNNQVTINPSGSLPRCAVLTVKVLDGLQNSFGVSGGSAWQYNSRTLCQSVFSIGTSVLGRSITAYSFGGGASKIIFVGTTHGDEKSSTRTLNSFIDYLESNAGSIPAHRTIIVIPNLNPDGYALSKRTNDNNVDLNRNFPANDWKQAVTMPGGSPNPNGGGSAPLSEPESAALASYVVGQNPRLVLTYHAAAGVVIPNDSGDSNALAHLYDQNSNVGYAPNNQTGALFPYDTTGSFETWLHDKHGITTLLVELWTKSSNEFTKNRPAMWAMVQLP